MTSRFYSLVITSEAIYYEGKQVGWLENPDDLPRYTNYLLTPLPESGGVQSFDWIVPSWLTKLRYDLYASKAESEQMMNTWRIEDNAVVEALRQNGFHCEQPQPKLIPGAIHIITRSIEDERAAEAASRWYETDCPIKWGNPYTLPDGRVLVPDGTALELKGDVPDLWRNRSVAYYQLNEESGTVARDLSGHGYDAELRRERQP